ncbi:MAG: cysteine synthase B, partial [Pseudomonadota bacterium]|nr:cysteine synthase B [Pseudomonadota bacterium]
MAYLTLEDTIGNTPLIQLHRIGGAEVQQRNNII